MNPLTLSRDASPSIDETTASKGNFRLPSSGARADGVVASEAAMAEVTGSRMNVEGIGMRWGNLELVSGK